MVSFLFVSMIPRLGTGDASNWKHQKRHPGQKSLKQKPISAAKDQERGILSRLLDNSSLLQPNHTGKPTLLSQGHSAIWGAGVTRSLDSSSRLYVYEDACYTAAAEAEAKKGLRTLTQTGRQAPQGTVGTHIGVLELPTEPSSHRETLGGSKRGREGGCLSFATPSPAERCQRSKPKQEV